MTTTDRMPNEGAQAYAAFRIYAELGAARSIARVRQQCKKSMSLLQRWSARWKWKARSELHDNQQVHAAQKAEEQAELELARVKAKRREMVQERAWDVAQKLMTKAEEMLNFPVGRQERTESADGKTVTMVAHPGDWKFGDTARMLTAADALARLSCGMATGKQELSGPDDKPFTLPGASIPTQMAVHVTYGKETDRAVAAFGDRPADGA